MEGTKMLNKRYDFVILFDVENGNPNGDPDAGNMPRIDPETGHGIVTDVCIKRKIRDYVELLKEDERGYGIYIKQGIPLNRNHRQAYEAIGKEEQDKLTVKSKDTIDEAKAFICKNFYDVRTFGAVMTTGANCGQVRGPVQLNFARSLDPIFPQDLTITRVTVTREEDGEKKYNEMGRKQIVPYALYRMEGHVSASLANDPHIDFGESDLELLWESIINMFEHDKSASRGKMVTRRLIVFEHSSILGNYPSHKLFEKVSIGKKDGVVVPRHYSDYTVEIEPLSSEIEVKVIDKV
jgi:CRISPR-associated protein Csd2